MSSVTYIENRVWMLAGEVREKALLRLLSAPCHVPLDALYEEIFSGAASTLEIGADCDPTTPREKPPKSLRLRLRFSADALLDLSRRLTVMDWRVSSLEIMLGGEFQLNMRTSFRPTNGPLPMTLGDWDTLANTLSSWIGEVLAAVTEKIVADLANREIVTLMAGYSWGVPHFLEVRNALDGRNEGRPMGREYCYIFSSTILLSATTDLQLDAIARILKLDLGAMFHWGGITGLDSWGWSVWKHGTAIDDIVLGSSELDELLSIEAVFMMHLNAVNSGVYINAGVMRRIAAHSTLNRARLGDDTARFGPR